MSKRIVTYYPDGTLKVIVEQESTLENTTFAEKLDIMYPTKTTEAEITAGWAEFDDHKRCK